MKKPKEPEAPPCAQCGQPSTGSLSIMFTPHRAPVTYDPGRMVAQLARDISFYAPFCGACLRQSVKISIDLHQGPRT